MEKPRQNAFKSKQEILEIIKWLHIKCGLSDTEHLFVLTINWLNYHEVPNVNVEITQNFYTAYCTPKSFFVEKYFDSWDPKIHSPRNYLHIFYVANPIDECSTNKLYPLAMFRNGISKKTISSYIGMMDDGIPSTSSDSAMTSKEIKNPRVTFKIQMKYIFYILKQMMMHCLIIGFKNLSFY